MPRPSVPVPVPPAGSPPGNTVPLGSVGSGGSSVTANFTATAVVGVIVELISCSHGVDIRRPVAATRIYRGDSRRGAGTRSHAAPQARRAPPPPLPYPVHRGRIKFAPNFNHANTLNATRRRFRIFFLRTTTTSCPGLLHARLNGFYFSYGFTRAAFKNV